MTERSDPSGGGGELPPIAEPRVACPTCGTHVLVESHRFGGVHFLCTVCGLRWEQSDEQSSDAPNHLTPPRS